MYVIFFFVFSCILLSTLLFLQAKNSDFYSSYVTEDFTTYLNRKRLDNCHGNHLEMQAMCEIYNRPIEVYQYSLGLYVKLDVPRHEKTGSCGFRPGPTQTGLYSPRKKLKA